MNIATRPAVPERASQVYQTQIAIVGAGLAGALAAILLGRAGYRVKVVDTRPNASPEFRVEKFTGDQIGTLRKLGMLDAVRSSGTPFSRITNIRAGRLVDMSYGACIGILYHDIVNTMRHEIPASDFLVGLVADVEKANGKQRVHLKNGDVVEADLVIMATGLRDVLRHKLGIERKMLVKRQSLTFGFNVVPKEGRFNFEALTCYGSRTSEGIDYLTLFPIGTTMRVNLFTFRDDRDPWIEQLVNDPFATLCASLPGLDRFTGRFGVDGKIERWAMDLTTVENHVQDGIVLVGDAFQTSCPAAGLGASRAMLDVDRLCSTYIPRWFATSGIGRDKIEQFYADPIKRDFDAKALESASSRRRVAIEEGLGWTLYRRRKFLTRRFVHLVDQANPGWVARARVELSKSLGKREPAI